jgi:glycogen operon protein
MQHPGVLEPARGTYEGMASEAAIAHFKRLGITALSLLPVHQSIPEKFIVDRGLTNYWGYSTIGFFAPDRRYARADPVAEFKTMVKRLHAAGLEVIIDVVYNHTAEGDQLGPTLSFRGIDNLAYYRLIAGDLSLYDNGTGCGNSVNVAHQRVLQLVMDSLRYWVTDMHVDGFRFDLATTVAREPGGFDVNGGFLDAVRQDPVLSRVKLIAEPWDIGLGGYQLGAFAPGWSEWNGQFRDTARSFWVQRQATRGELAGRLAASHELFGHRGRRPQASINFVTAHDGFTLRDLVMYNDKHNEANGEDNRDGTDDNRSWNCGIEGPSDDAEIEAQRARLQRTLLATLFLSQGVPMMLGGDELSRTQQGNNNAYCQDNEINWFQWQDADQRLIDYTAHLIDLRKRYPTLRRTHWLQGVWGETGEHDVRWLDATGADIPDNEWSDATKQAFAMLLPKWDDSHPTILLLFNGADHGVIFTLPEGTWTMVLDTDNDEVAPRSPPGELIVAARGIVVLEKAADRRDSP